ncbi:MAG: hypothetical protein HYV40_00220 [Candidatus Levybacteria bacterium]|nr:hypothetical protein [Candidatus Levybacteria bacterium]
MRRGNREGPTVDIKSLPLRDRVGIFNNFVAEAGLQLNGDAKFLLHEAGRGISAYHYAESGEQKEQLKAAFHETTDRLIKVGQSNPVLLQQFAAISFYEVVCFAFCKPQHTI